MYSKRSERTKQAKQTSTVCASIHKHIVACVVDVVVVVVAAAVGCAKDCVMLAEQHVQNNAASCAMPFPFKQASKQSNERASGAYERVDAMR